MQVRFVADIAIAVANGETFANPSKWINTVFCRRVYSDTRSQEIIDFLFINGPEKLNKAIYCFRYTCCTITTFMAKKIKFLISIACSLRGSWKPIYLYKGCITIYSSQLDFRSKQIILKSK